MKNIENPQTGGYPKFIIDKPIGKDLFKGKSQENLANNISQFILESNHSKKVIGIEGEWGSGKSNVIEILKDKLKANYHIFVFDAWGYQEDLTRRSILEGLLTNLIHKGILKNKNEKWPDELKSLLARKVDKKQRTIPKLSLAVVLSLVGIILMPISNNIAETYLGVYTTDKTNPSFCNYWISFLILLTSFIPLFVWFIYSYFKVNKDERKNVINEFFYIYKGQEIENTSTETISEEEPTILQFTNFLSKIEKDASKSLIIVFDNMDRLPETKVKEIWSTIHTFFANDENGLKSWAIVPFDNAHITEIFNSGEKRNSESYVHKTFSIVFHVSPPILSDWKGYFNSKFNEAFGYLPPIDQHIETIFDYYHVDDPKIKPRDIIFYINDLVALKILWKEEIQFKYLALFSLLRSEIMKNPFEAILQRTFLKSMGNIFDSDETIETNIAALAFNVPIVDADEILLKRPIQAALSGNGDFSELSKHKSFLTFLDSVFYNTNFEINHAIKSINKLPQEIQDTNQVISYWESFTNYLIIKTFDIQYTESIMLLIKNLKNADKVDQLLKYLFNGAVNLSPEKEKFFKSFKYFELYNEVNQLLSEYWPNKILKEYLPSNFVKPDEFIEFVDACGIAYKELNLSFSEENIEKYLIEKFDLHEIEDYYPALQFIKIDFNLSLLNAHIKSTLSALTIEADKYEVYLKSIIELGKHLSLDGKTIFPIDEPQASNFLAEIDSKILGVDLILSIIKSNIDQPNPAHVEYEAFSKFVTSTKNETSIISEFEYYLNYSDLIKYNLTFPNILLKNVIIKLTSGDLGNKGSDGSYLVLEYENIKSNIFESNNELCNQFVNKISQLATNSFPGIVNISDLSFGLPIIYDNSTVECDLVDFLISSGNTYLLNADKETWVKELIDSDNSKLLKLFALLENINKYSGASLSDSFNSAFSEVIEQISNKNIPVPLNTNLWNRLIELLPNSPITSFKNVRDDLFNYQHSDVTIDELIFFEKGLFQFGELDHSYEIADETLRRILIPLASYRDPYINILKRNPESVKRIIEQGQNSIVDFKNAIDTHYPEAYNDSETKDFMDSLKVKYDQLIPKPIQNEAIEDENK